MLGLPLTFRVRLVLILFGLDCVVGQDTRGKAEACTA